MREAGGRTPLSRRDQSISPFGASFVVPPIEPGIAERTFSQAGAVDVELTSSSDGPLTEFDGSFEIASHKSAVGGDANGDRIPFMRDRRRAVRSQYRPSWRSRRACTGTNTP